MVSVTTDYLYALAWNQKLRRPLGEEGKYLSEDEARRIFENGESALAVLPDFVGEVAPAWVIEIGSGARPAPLAVQLFDEEGCVVLRLDYQLRSDRLFCTRIMSWKYPPHDTYLRMPSAELLTTTTFEPDGTGTLEIRDKTDPSSDARLAARDIPVDDNWVQFPEFGRWQPLIDSAHVLNSRPALR